MTRCERYSERSHVTSAVRSTGRRKLQQTLK